MGLTKPILRSQSLDDFCVDLWEKSTPEDRLRLTAEQVKTVRKPKIFARRTLDYKLTVAAKLRKRVYLIVMDDDAYLDHHDFAQIFRQPFIDAARNKNSMDILEGKGMMITGNETVERFVHRAELFINSDLYEVARVIKRMKNKKASVNTVIPDKDAELRGLFMHTILRMFFATKHMDEHLKSMALNPKQFAILCALYLTAMPLTNDQIRTYISKVMWAVGDMRSDLRHLVDRGYINSTELKSDHHHKRTAIFMMIGKGHDAIADFVKRVTDETIATAYEG